MSGGIEVDRAARDSLAAYVRRAKTLRQIHSNKGAAASWRARAYLGITIGLGTTVSLLGFAGTAGISRALGGRIPESDIGILYALSVLFIVVLSIFGLIYRFDERAARHYRSIEILTDFIRDSEDKILLSDRGVALLDTNDLAATRIRYKGILSALPPNTDKEYIKAKQTGTAKAVAKGEAEEALMQDYSSRWFADDACADLDPALATRLTALMIEDGGRMSILRTVASTLGSSFWLTGGFIRDSAWDLVHGYSIPTPLDDVDVVYFDAKETSVAHEDILRRRLVEKSPNINWSVKNEARMHQASGDSPYVSLAEAVGRFPETATAIAVQLSDARLRILAPHGLGDLFSLALRPTSPDATFALDRRATEKQWLKRWPELNVVPAQGES